MAPLLDITSNSDENIQRSARIFVFFSNVEPEFLSIEIVHLFVNICNTLRNVSRMILDIKNVSQTLAKYCFHSQRSYSKPARYSEHQLSFE